MKLALILTLMAGAPSALASDLPYFQQFLYQTSTDADGNVSTRFLDSTSPQGTFGFPVGNDSRGNPVFGQVQLFLMPDGTFSMDYTEVNAQGLPLGFQFPPDTKFKGTWSVPDAQFLLGDIATGAREADDTGEGVELTFIKDLSTPGLKGKSVTLDFGHGNLTPDTP
jgi:hypothetical protein